MKNLSYLILSYLILSITLVSCEKNDNNALEEIQYSAEIRAITNVGPSVSNPDNPPALCIFCGCGKDYKECKNWNCDNNPNHGCCIWNGVNQPQILDISCCKDLRNDCHDCPGSTFICVQIDAVFEAGDITDSQKDDIDNGKIKFGIDELTAEQVQLLEPYEGVIEKWQDGITLTASDYDVLETPLSEFQ